MDTLLIQITNIKALQLLRDLEELNLIKVLKTGKSPKSQKLSEKFAGSIPDQVGNDLLKQLKNSRKEWDERDI